MDKQTREARFKAVKEAYIEATGKIAEVLGFIPEDEAKRFLAMYDAAEQFPRDQSKGDDGGNHKS